MMNPANLKWALILGLSVLSLRLWSCSPTHPCELSRGEHQLMTASLRQEGSGLLIRMISDGTEEAADASRPQLVVFPNGEKKYVMGFSAQALMLVDSLDALTRGGTHPLSKAELRNKNGFLYGSETDPLTGLPLGDSRDSATWDLAIFSYVKDNGVRALKVFAGAMGDDERGRPLLLQYGHNNTRQRVGFDGEWIQSLDGLYGYTLLASNPKTSLNTGTPVEGNWVETDASGAFIFNHGYGGEPVTLGNGELYVDERGWVPFVHEMVVEQRNYPDPQAPYGLRKVPYRTAIVVTYLDKKLEKIMEPAQIIFDVFKPDGSLWKASHRDSAGPLVEGPHIEVRHEGRPVHSSKELQGLRKKNVTLDFQMLFSAGEFFGHYGSYLALSRGNLQNFKPMLDDVGELWDVTAPLRVLFTWIGRPVSFHVGEQEYLLVHGIDRSTIPAGIYHEGGPLMDQWRFFKRQMLVVPVVRRGKRLELVDESGLVEALKNYRPVTIYE